MPNNWLQPTALRAAFYGIEPVFYVSPLGR